MSERAASGSPTSTCDGWWLAMGAVAAVIIVFLGLGAIRMYHAEKRSWQIEAAFSDERLRAIAADEGAARDFELMLLRTCVLEDRCDLLRKSGVIDRWLFVRPKGGVEHWVRAR